MTPRPGALRAAFLTYTLVLFTATHWPALVIEGAGRPDLLVHVAAFALWTVLLLLTRWTGPLDRPATYVRAGLIAAAWAALDEFLQAVPVLRRDAGFDDYLADLAGVVLGAVGVAISRRFFSSR